MSEATGRSADDRTAIREVEVAILGAGLCGIGVAIRLAQDGITDTVLLERDGSIGGTWNFNTYPGCACDIPSHLYSFSYALNPDWSRVYSPQSEIQGYLERVVDDHGLRGRIRTGTEVTAARWDEARCRWRITTTHETYDARFFVVAAGPLHEPVVPNLPGLDTFAGERFHSSQWPADLDLTGKSVVAIGTGASAVQFVPAIADRVGELLLIQRTPSWVLPKPDWSISARTKMLLRRFPVLAKAIRGLEWGLMDPLLIASVQHPRVARLLGVAGRATIRWWIRDTELREILTPEYLPTCKRLCFSNDFYPALAKPNVTVVDSAAASIGEHSVTTADGVEHHADVIVFGTGFHTMQSHPVNDRITGRGGRTLAQVWGGDPQAHMGTAVSGFPNAYVMFGPNVGTLSGFVMAEAQADYIAGALATVRLEGVGALDVREEAQREFVDHADDVHRGSTFALGGCDSYYLADDNSRRVSLPWPGTMASLRRRLRHFDADSYERITAPTRVPDAGSPPERTRVIR